MVASPKELAERLWTLLEIRSIFQNKMMDNVGHGQDRRKDLVEKK